MSFNFYLDVSVFKSQESQTSDAICLTYSSIDESINENTNPNLPKNKRCNVLKDLQMNKQDNVIREYDNSDDRNFYTAKQQGAITFNYCNINRNNF